MTGVRFRVRGRVQGVGFRAFTARVADALGVVGWCRNEPDGTVVGEAAGDPEAIERFLQRIGQGPRSGRVDDLSIQPLDPNAPAGSRFEIRR